MQKLMIAILSTLCLAACSTITANPPPPPAEYMVCEGLPAAPDISPLQAFQAENGAMVYYKADVDARDALVAPYVVAIRGAWFSCSNQLERNRDYYAEQE